MTRKVPKKQRNARFSDEDWNMLYQLAVFFGFKDDNGQYSRSQYIADRARKEYQSIKK